ncbi:F-box domain [Cedratvirus A11]|uniref:F-box domain n=1 Tax=Cedratvirus A11 TaxID=1903266 RepID=A0A1M7XUE5_9VIRU|nr:F-box domain [Cedratvirus A11]SHO33315.1 F-box domain [Cedratvirus A11]
MQDLPEELQEEVLFSLRQPEDLSRACSVSRASRRVCSGSLFWRERFRRENLPLLEEGGDLTQWLKIYRKSLETARKVDERILSGRNVRVSLTSVDDPKILLPLGNTEEIMRYWNIMKTRTHIEKQRNYITVHVYMLEFFPDPGTKSRYELVDNYITEDRNPRYMSEMEKMPVKVTIRGGNVSTEDLWFILFRVGYSTKYIL